MGLWGTIFLQLALGGVSTACSVPSTKTGLCGVESWWLRLLGDPTVFNSVATPVVVLFLLLIWVFFFWCCITVSSFLEPDFVRLLFEGEFKGNSMSGLCDDLLPIFEDAFTWSPTCICGGGCCFLLLGDLTESKLCGGSGTSLGFGDLVLSPISMLEGCGLLMASQKGNTEISKHRLMKVPRGVSPIWRCTPMACVYLQVDKISKVC